MRSRSGKCGQTLAIIICVEVVHSVKCQPGSGAFGLGCAIAVNKVLQAALGHTIPVFGQVCGGAKWFPVGQHGCSPDWVPDVVQALLAGGYGEQVNSSKAVQGDLVVQDGGDAVNGMNHIGICENTPCTSVLSNAGTSGTLCGETNTAFSNNGYTYPQNLTPTFYHIF